MTWGTYGGRAGVWRLIKILDDNKVPGTFVANARALELAPAAAKQAIKSGHEIAAHSYTQDALLAYLDPKDENALINRCVDIGVDAGHDRSHRAPRHSQQLRHRALRGPDCKPGCEVVEVAGVARTVACPRHRRDRHPMVVAANPRRVRLEEHSRCPEIQRPPPSTTLTKVITR